MTDLTLAPEVTTVDTVRLRDLLASLEDGEFAEAIEIVRAALRLAEGEKGR